MATVGVRQISDGAGLWMRMAAIGTVMVLCGCSSFQDRPPDPAVVKRLAEVDAIAGSPVNSFRFMRMSSFEPIGLQHLLVFTTPHDAWLLRLDAPCRLLDFGPFMGITSHMHLVMAGVDSVRVRDNPIPCRIEQIRPVDALRLRHVDRERKAQGTMDLDQPVDKPKSDG